MSAHTDSAVLQEWLDRLAAGDNSARAGLISSAEARLVTLTRRMLRKFPAVHRWEMTDDVFQNSVLTIHAALANVTPRTVEDFICFAAYLIRRELINLSRHYCGPQGMAQNHQSGSAMLEGGKPGHGEDSAELLTHWTEFHQAVDALPQELRTVFDLLWYQDLTQIEAAKVLNVSERTVQRRWYEARIKLHTLISSDAEEY